MEIYELTEEEDKIKEKAWEFLNNFTGVEITQNKYTN